MSDYIRDEQRAAGITPQQRLNEIEHRANGFRLETEMTKDFDWLISRVRELEAARVEAIDIIRASNNSCRCDVILAEMQENFILKYGGES